MVIEDPGEGLWARLTPFLLLSSELLPVLIYEGFIDAFNQTFQRASLNFCASQHVRPNSFSGSILILFTCVFIFFFLCVCIFKAGLWTDNYARAPRHIYKSVSLTTQIIAKLTPLQGLPMPLPTRSLWSLSIFFFFCSATQSICVWDYWI